jgi:hypothetical protein
LRANQTPTIENGEIMMSICPYCEESTRFIANNSERENPVWYHCEQCERNLKKGKHPNAKSLPNDAVIVIEDDYVTDPADYDYEPVEEKEEQDNDLELKLQQALALAELERRRDELDEPKEKEVKKPLLEKNKTKEIMRMLEYESDEKDEEDYEEKRYSQPREQLYEETIILREILTRNRCNKQFIEFAIEVIYPSSMKTIVM